MATFVILYCIILSSVHLTTDPISGLPRLLLIAAATPEHAGRPLSTHAVLRQRAPEPPRPPLWCQCAVCVLGAVQPPGSLPHHHVWYRHAEVSLAPHQHYYTACVVSLDRQLE